MDTGQQQKQLSDEMLSSQPLDLLQPRPSPSCACGADLRYTSCLLLLECEELLRWDLDLYNGEIAVSLYAVLHQAAQPQLVTGGRMRCTARRISNKTLYFQRSNPPGRGPTVFTCTKR